MALWGAILESRHHPTEAEVQLPTVISARFEEIRNMLTGYGMDEGSLYVTRISAEIPTNWHRIVLAKRSPHIRCTARMSGKLLTPRLDTIANPPLPTCAGYTRI